MQVKLVGKTPGVLYRQKTGGEGVKNKPAFTVFHCRDDSMA